MAATVTIEVTWENGDTQQFELGELEWEIAARQSKDQDWMLFLDTKKQIQQLNLNRVRSIRKVT